MTCRSPRLVLLALVLLPVGATACKKRSPGTETEVGTIRPAPTTVTETGWPLHEVRQEGFAVALPPDWRQFDMNPATFERTFREALKADPQLAPVYGNLAQQIKSGVKFFGIDQSSMATGFTTNVNVLRLPLPPGATLGAVADENARQMEALPSISKPIARDRVKAAAGDGVRFRYRMTFRQPDGQGHTVAITQSLFVSAADYFVVTLTTGADREAHYRETFEKIGESFRLLK